MGKEVFNNIFSFLDGPLLESKGTYFEPERNLKSDLKRKQTKGKLRCQECEFTSNYKGNLKRHVEDVHKGVFSSNRPGKRCAENGQYLCQECDFKSNHKTALRVHIDRIHNGVLNYSCSQCEFKSNQRHSMKNHLKTHSSKEATVISLKKDKKLDIESKGTPNLNFKRERQTAGKFRCQLCEFASIYKGSLKRHVEDVHKGVFSSNRPGKRCAENGQYLCQECDFKSNHKTALRTHIDRIHEGVLNYSCSQCEFKSFQRHTMNNHIKTHSTKDAKVISLKRNKKLDIDQKFTCDLCQYSSNSKQHFEAHTKSVHQKVVKYFCSYCEFKSYFLSAVKQHHNIHHANLVFKILKICCKSNSDCNHEPGQRATDACYKFGCNKCNLKSNTSQAILTHIANKHIWEKVEVLKLVCTKKINNHQCQESGFDLRYKCTDCELRFINENDLENHIGCIHKNVKRFQCSVCGNQQFNKSMLTYHIKERHRNDQTKPTILALDCIECTNDKQHSEHRYVATEIRKQEKPKTEKKEKIQRMVVPYFCSECNHSPFESHSLILKHFKTNHPGKNIFKCVDCNYSSNFISNINTHRNSKHERKLLQCEKCQFKTTWNTSFWNHKRNIHGEHQRKSKYYSVGKDFLCDGCGLSTVSKELYAQHIAVGNCSDAPKRISKYGNILPGQPRTKIESR